MKWLQNDQVSLSPDEEKILLETGKQIFSTEFPNPEGRGCPSREILRKLVYRTESLTLKDREHWLDHISACSPCFNAFSGFRDTFIKKKRVKRSIVVAVVGVGLLSWLWFLKNNLFHPPGQPSIVKEQPVPTPEPVPPSSQVPPSTQKQQSVEVQVAVLDLRFRGVARGENNSRDGDLHLPRGRLKLSIYLPIGSDEGTYEVRVSGRQKQVAKAKGKASIQDHRNVLAVEIDTSAFDPGKATLSIRQKAWGWSTYPLRLK